MSNSASADQDLTTQATALRDAIQLRIDDLNDELAEIDERRADIRGQIEKAKADRITTGVYADPDWFRRATGALRHLGVERNAAARELGEANRALRKANDRLNRDLFYEAVRAVVDALTWERIVDRHNALRGDI